MKNKTFYIAGPMTGLPDANRAAFHAAEAELRELGAKDVLNPAHQPDGLTYCQYMTHALGLLEKADAILMLPGFFSSLGANFELEVAYRDKKAVYIKTSCGIYAAKIKGLRSK